MKKFLDRVRRLKLDEIEKRKEKFSEKFLRNKLEESIDIPEFKKNLLRNYDEEISLILEVKTRSPGKRNIDSLENLYANLLGTHNLSILKPVSDCVQQPRQLLQSTPIVNLHVQDGAVQQ